MSELLVCVACGNYYIKDRIKPNFNNTYMCPNVKGNCGNSLISIDENLVDLIMKFWELGMKTWSSCEGHPYDLSIPYIYFYFHGYSECNNARANFILFNKRNNNILEISDTSLKKILPPVEWWKIKHEAYTTFRVSAKVKNIENLPVIEKLEMKNMFIKYMYRFIEWIT